LSPNELQKRPPFNRFYAKKLYGNVLFKNGQTPGMGVSPMDLFFHGRDARATMISPPNQHEHQEIAVSPLLPRAVTFCFSGLS
jgi:hypothetical protein